MINRAEYYKNLSENDVRIAFKEIKDDILQAQNLLKFLVPNPLNHPLLNLVKIYGEDNISTSKNLREQINFRLERNENKPLQLYEGLGYYIDFLYEEIEIYKSNKSFL